MSFTETSVGQRRGCCGSTGSPGPIDIGDSSSSRGHSSPPSGCSTLSKLKRMRCPMIMLPDAPHACAEETKQDAGHCEPMSEILGFLWLGSWRDAREGERLTKAGITHILNLAKEHPTEEEERQMSHTGCVCKEIPMEDAQCEDLNRHLCEAHNFINAARACDGKVLVHCRRGISRSPAIVVSYLMRFEQMSYDTALDFVRHRRHCVSLNLGFREHLRHWEPPRGNTPSAGASAELRDFPRSHV